MKRILIVDDAATVRMYHRSILESAGYTVEEALTGSRRWKKPSNALRSLHSGREYAQARRLRLSSSELRQQQIHSSRPSWCQPKPKPATRRGLPVGRRRYLIKPVRPAQLSLMSASCLGR